MTKKRNELVYVGHMYDMARKVSVRFEGRTREEFDANEDLQIVTLHLIQTMGEAAGRVSEEFRSRHPQVPWGEIVAMRNRLVHDYLHVDLTVVWEVATQHINPLIEQLAAILGPEAN